MIGTHLCVLTRIAWHPHTPRDYKCWSRAAAPLCSALLSSTRTPAIGTCSPPARPPARPPLVHATLLRHTHTHTHSYIYTRTVHRPQCVRHTIHTCVLSNDLRALSNFCSRIDFRRQISTGLGAPNRRIFTGFHGSLHVRQYCSLVSFRFVFCCVLLCALSLNSQFKGFPLSCEA